jgi:Ca2+-transporting ATPase
LFDKTGTLTKGEMTVRKIFAGGRMIEVTGSSYTWREFKGSDTINITKEQSLQLLLKKEDCSVVTILDKRGQVVY